MEADRIKRMDPKNLKVSYVDEMPEESGLYAKLLNDFFKSNHRVMKLEAFNEKDAMRLYYGFNQAKRRGKQIKINKRGFVIYVSKTDDKEK